MEVIMKKVIIIKSINQLKAGMEVEFRFKSLQKSYVATVINVQYNQEQRFLGFKPVRFLSVKSAELKCKDGGRLIVTENNFDAFKILKIK